MPGLSVSCKPTPLGRFERILNEVSPCVFLPSPSLPQKLHPDLLNRKMGVIEVTLMKGLYEPGPWISHLPRHHPIKYFLVLLSLLLAEEKEASHGI